MWLLENWHYLWTGYLLFSSKWDKNVQKNTVQTTVILSSGPGKTKKNKRKVWLHVYLSVVWFFFFYSCGIFTLVWKKTKHLTTFLSLRGCCLTLGTNLSPVFEPSLFFFAQNTLTPVVLTNRQVCDDHVSSVVEINPGPTQNRRTRWCNGLVAQRLWMFTGKTKDKTFSHLINFVCFVLGWGGVGN